MNIKYPTVSWDKRNNVLISFYKENKRYRISNGDKIGIKLKPNSFPIEKRLEMGKLLAGEVFKFLQTNKDFCSSIKTKESNENKSDLEIIKEAYNVKLKANLSEKYYQTLRHIIRELGTISKQGIVDKAVVDKFLNTYINNTSYNTIRTHLNALLNEAVNLGLKSNPIKDIKRKRQEAKLHKPFQDILLVLNDIKDFHTHLYLCCLLTYGCLLRPHREIRELKWSDFSDDYNYINLAGSRNKSKKNRIVPVPEFVKNELTPTLLNHNIFSDNTKPFNPSYFKTLWGRYNRQSTILEDNQTLYSFRHAGAIDIFKRTGSLHKLQTAMGHSSLIVTTTYLRGLEVCELRKEDMPVLSF
tara:strand:+ start:123 stop:1190 length:1068 start_codon:yes stop_codon:yes gene_type:complete